ncbi:MAG: Hpt domain-containing protein [Elusimicrobiota bacterium]|jgi:HPt (histidine-containing phosphotransfer) domain-containing protein|nr:Hpt domain-containing protein [Elusimicrobiota bacterium]
MENLQTSEQHQDYGDFVPFINVEEGIKRLVNNRALYFKLLNNFQGRDFAQKIIDAANDKNYEAVAQAAHTLKGVAANLSLTALSEISLQIELLAKQSRDIGHLKEECTETVEKTLSLIARLTS